MSTNQARCSVLGMLGLTLALPACGKEVTELALGNAHTCARIVTKVRCWGGNSGGQLGYGNTKDIGDDETPASAGDVDLGGAAMGLAAGAFHTCALLTGGEVRCWGKNDSGQLGYGDRTTRTKPGGNVELGGPAKQIAAGYSHTCAVLMDGRLRCWGWNGWGQLGHPGKAYIGLDEKPASVGPVNVGGTVRQVAAGWAQTCALLEGGAVRCWGNGPEGQLGYGNTKIIGDDETPASAGDVNVGGPVQKLAMGEVHTCALLNSGKVRCWGRGYNRQLGYGNEHAIGDDETPASAGDVKVGGTAVDIAAGGYATCAVLASGSLRCWGTGATGLTKFKVVGDTQTPAEVGDVVVGAKVLRVQMGWAHTCVIVEGGKVRCWGEGGSGQLGYGNTKDIGDDETPLSAGDVTVQ